MFGFFLRRFVAEVLLAHESPAVNGAVLLRSALKDTGPSQHRDIQRTSDPAMARARALALILAFAAVTRRMRGK